MKYSRLAMTLCLSAIFSLVVVLLLPTKARLGGADSPAPNANATPAANVPRLAHSATFAPGDLFLAEFTGVIQWRDSAGKLIMNINDAGGTGLRHHPITGELWATEFYSSLRIVHTDGNVGSYVSVPSQSYAESVVFDSAGNAYVGGPRGNLVKLDDSGDFIEAYELPQENTGGPDWIELGCDQRTIYYTSEGSHIKRYDTVTKSPLPDFANLGGGSRLFALRLLKDGTILVAAEKGVVYRLNQAGSIIKTYFPTNPVFCMFALALTPDGNAFWAGGLCPNGPMYKFDIASGAVLDFKAGPYIHGIAVYGDYGFSRTDISVQDLYVSSFSTAEVMRYDGLTGSPKPSDGNTGARFVPSGSGGPMQPMGLTFDMAGNLYVSNFSRNSVMRYDRASVPFGADWSSTNATFVSSQSGGLVTPHGLTFGPDHNYDGVGDLYVGSIGTTNNVLTYDAIDGTFSGVFINGTPPGQGPFTRGVAFGGGVSPPGDLYVTSGQDVLRYRRATGAYAGVFASDPGNTHYDLTFGPDSDLYVTSFETNKVRRFSATGAPKPDFVTAGSGGLDHPTGLAFGPDCDLYVSSSGTNEILRYNGKTGAFKGAFVTTGSGGLAGPTYLTFGPKCATNLIPAGHCQAYSSCKRLSDYDGDGRNDIAIWRPSTGSWWSFGSAPPNSVRHQQWGAPNDKIVPGDYDGDGFSEAAVWRPNTGEWWISNGSPVTIIGGAGDTPVPMDYDGDGKTDIAVWQPSTFPHPTWHIIKSSGGFPLIVSPADSNSTDIPVPQDYDGDCKANLAVWRPSTGDWYIFDNSGNTISIQHLVGQFGDKPVPMDYDGDGKADLAVWHLESNGTATFYIKNNSCWTTIQPWGLVTDLPVPACYDGDGKADMAVFRPNDPGAGQGTWYILNSSDNSFSAVVWGASNDLPVTGAYIP